MAIQGQVLKIHTHFRKRLMESQFSNHWKMTNITFLSSKVAHDLVSNFKWGSSALKEISIVLPDLTRVEGRDVTEMPNAFRTKDS